MNGGRSAPRSPKVYIAFLGQRHRCARLFAKSTRGYNKQYLHIYNSNMGIEDIHIAYLPNEFSCVFKCRGSFKSVVRITTRHISAPWAARDQFEISMCSIFSLVLYLLLDYSLTVMFPCNFLFWKFGGFWLNLVIFEQI